MYRYVLFVVTLVLSQVLGRAKTVCLKHYHQQNFTTLARAYGHSVRTYEVQTEDNYYLKLFHIPGKKKPVLLMHGIVDSADTFILRGNGSLAISLANVGYDVWVGNTRGNRYSRKHLYLNPDLDEEFWDYSFHEGGVYDLPAIIDFVLKKTGTPKLSAIGHSQGNTIFYVLGALRPEYNSKIDILIALSPMCYLNNLKNTATTLAEIIPYFNNFLMITGQEEVFGENSVARVMYKELCGCKRSYSVCAQGLFFRIAGSDPEEMEPDFLPTLVEHYPTSTSRKAIQHTVQTSLRKKFSQYDYGPLNLNLYNSSEPPEYELRNVDMPIALLVGINDSLSVVKDVETLRDTLPNVTEYIILKHEKFNYIDAVWGKRMYKYLFPHIFHILEKYAD